MQESGIPSMGGKKFTIGQNGEDVHLKWTDPLEDGDALLTPEDAIQLGLALIRAGQRLQGARPGGEDIYRVTAVPDDGRSPETEYYRSPYEARGWSNLVRSINVPTEVSRAPAEAFEDLSDKELDRLAEDELSRIKDRS